MQTLPLDSVIIREDLYPRMTTDPTLIQTYQENIDVLPPIEVNQRFELIDGRHRLTAHKAAGVERIAVEVTETASEAELLLLACARNATHGFQLTSADKRRMARRIYQTADYADRPAVKKQLAVALSVHLSSVNRWISDVDKHHQAELKQQAFDLWLAFHTQSAVSERLNLPQQTISRMVADFTQIERLPKLSKIAAEFGDFDPELYGVWTHSVKADGVAHPGNSDPRILENLLYSYTNPFDGVIDPFGGGGSTIDVCKRRFRRYWVSDLTPIVAREAEIRQHDITAGMPLVPRWQDVRLVYLDPPYWRQAEGWYGDSPANLANVDAGQFHAAVVKAINGFAAKLNGGAKIALLIAPTQWKAPNHGFVDHLLAINAGVDMPVIERIQCPYSSEQATAQMVNWAKQNKRRLALQRELTVWEV